MKPFLCSWTIFVDLMCKAVNKLGEYMDSELIVVIERERLNDINGFHPYDDFEKAKNELGLTFEAIERSEMEISDKHIQVIAACVMKLPSGEHITLRKYTKGSAPVSPSALLATAEVKPEHLRSNVTGALRTAIGKDLVEQFTVPFPRVTLVEPLGIIIDRLRDSPKRPYTKACFLFSVELTEVPSPANSPLLPTTTKAAAIGEFTDRDDYDRWSRIYIAQRHVSPE